MDFRFPQCWWRCATFKPYPTSPGWDKMKGQSSLSFRGSGTSSAFRLHRNGGSVPNQATNPRLASPQSAQPEGPATPDTDSCQSGFPARPVQRREDSQAEKPAPYCHERPYAAHECILTQTAHRCVHLIHRHRAFRRESTVRVLPH